MGTRVCVLLPATGSGLDTARYAARHAAAAGAELVVAVTLPSAHMLHGWGLVLPIQQLQSEFVLDMMMQLTVELTSSGVPWDLVPVGDPGTDLPAVLRDRDVAELFVHADTPRWLVRGRRAARVAAALARRSTAAVWLVRADRLAPPGIHSQDHDLIRVNGGRRADRRRIV